MKRTVTQDGVPTRAVRSRRSSGGFSKKGQVKMYRGPRPGTPNGVHQFVKALVIPIGVYDNGWGIGGTRGPAFSLQFNLQDAIFTITGGTSSVTSVPGYVELSALFDQIMLDKVIVKFQYGMDPASQPPVSFTASQSPLLYHCIDYNDAGVPATLETVMQYGNQKSGILAAELGPIVRVVRPKYAQVLFNGGAGTTYAAKRGFVNALSDVPHYGMKGFMLCNSASGGLTSIGVVSLQIQYFYKCKNTL